MATSVQDNIKQHHKIHKQYNQRHTEIYNHIEQQRLVLALTRAKKSIRSDSKKLTALDYGCGDGNLTDQLLKLGFNVTAADVTPGFLQLITQKFPQNRCQTMLVNGTNLSHIPANSFDLVATYSVLHHVPDYLAIIKEFARVVKPGGLMYLDHERSADFWHPPAALAVLHNLVALKQQQKMQLTKGQVRQQLTNELKRKTNLIQFLRVQKRNYVLKKNPRFQEEGDIHVFADDHIEWPKIEALLKKQKMQVVFKDEFLLNDSRLYTPEEYQVFSQICHDEACLAAIKL